MDCVFCLHACLTKNVVVVDGDVVLTKGMICIERLKQAALENIWRIRSGLTKHKFIEFVGATEVVRCHLVLSVQKLPLWRNRLLMRKFGGSVRGRFH